MNKFTTALLAAGLVASSASSFAGSTDFKNNSKYDINLKIDKAAYTVNASDEKDIENTDIIRDCFFTPTSCSFSYTDAASGTELAHATLAITNLKTGEATVTINSIDSSKVYVTVNHTRVSAPYPFPMNINTSVYITAENKD